MTVDLKIAKKILTATQVNQKIKRIAYEIYEKNFEEQSIVLFGIDGGGEGFTLAKLISKELVAISAIKVDVIKISFDKEAVSPEIVFDKNIEIAKDKVVILIDDVLNTGKTIMLSLVELMKIKTKKIQIGVMINRDYIKFPVHAEMVGYALSTTISEQVRVILSKKEENGVYLI
jgi:pyrimidine operon attenuation protein / uracil phosphoribosyltransferase